MSPVVAPLERLATRVRIWRYEERHAARARSQQEARERLQIARACHLH